MKEQKRDVIVEMTSKKILPIILTFGLYVMVGTEGAGGGFQGGCIIAAAFILYAVVFGIQKGRTKMPESWNTFFTSLGLYLYCGCGLLAIIASLFVAEFLNYSAFWPLTNLFGPYEARALQVEFVVEVGIGITVFAAFVSMFYDLAWKDEDEAEDDEEVMEC
ncbi:MAG: MnhB domain-containing protein [Archaeoglobales archaeon]|nr:MnhB domain-containing protein [Archaeoglobales archaeon]